VIDSTDDAVIPLNAAADFILKKSAFSKRVRVLFVTGLEHAGHHELSFMLDVCSKLDPPACEQAISLSSKVMNYDQAHKTIRGLSSAADTPKSFELATVIRHTFEHIRNKTGDHLYFIGFGAKYGAKKSFTVSTFPKYPIKIKPSEYPDIYQLTATAESANVDMRILVLQRNPLALMQILERSDSDIDFEDFRSWILQLGFLYSQLSLLDRKFYYCLPFESLEILQTSPDKMEQLQLFLHPNTMTNYAMNEMLMQLKHYNNNLKPTLKRPAATNIYSAGNSVFSRSYLMMQLNARMSLINDMCNKPERVV
jgi:hypothetical protein